MSDMEDAATPAPPENAALGPDDCALRLLLVNGEDFNLVLPVFSAVRDVKQAVIDQQPQKLLEFLKQSPPGGVPPPGKVEEIRLLHLGKLLEDGKTLKDCNFRSGPEAVTTVHISCRVPSNALEDVKDKLNKKSGTCCVLM